MKKRSPLSIIISFIAVVILVYAFGLNNIDKKPSNVVEGINNAIGIVKDMGSDLINNIDQNASYTKKEDIKLYIETFGKLPKNFITKKSAIQKGWDSTKNYLGDVCKGMSIGGDLFGNYEDKLPVIKGRKYYECDVDYNGKQRNSKRIVYSNDGLIYYTSDHYKNFELLSERRKNP